MEHSAIEVGLYMQFNHKNNLEDEVRDLRATIPNGCPLYSHSYLKLFSLSAPTLTSNCFPSPSQVVEMHLCSLGKVVALYRSL